MKIRIRHAEPDDYQAVHQVYSQAIAYSGTLQLPYVAAETWKKRLSSNPDSSFTLVATVDDEIVGSHELFVSQALRRRHAGSIGMGVRDDWQGKGVGTELLTAAVDLADNWVNIVRLGFCQISHQVRLSFCQPGGTW